MTCNHIFKKKGVDKVCEKCGHILYKCEVYSRVVGYIRPVGDWNDSKQAEFADRKKFDSSIERREEQTKVV